MAIIIISRGSYSKGREVAKRLAERLNYKIISREELIDSASKEFDIPEAKLLHIIEDTPSFWDRITHRKDKYIAYINKTLLELIKQDNIIYHGFGGTFFVRDIPHILKVRVNAEMDLRVKFVMERDRVTKEEAIKIIKRLDEARRKWNKLLYGGDIQDMDLYDIIVNMTNYIDIEDIIEALAKAALSKPFQITSETIKAIEERLKG